MEILQQIGVNQTALIQFVIFLFALLFLYNVVFKPYSHALEEREKRTKGGEDLALEIQKQALDLQRDYESKAREVSSQVKSIFDTHKMTATKDAEFLVAQARSEAEKLVQNNRDQVQISMRSASENLKGQTTQVALAITQKILGK